MKEAIDKLKAACARVRTETGSAFVIGYLRVSHDDSVSFQIFRDDRTHSADDLDSVVEISTAFNSKSEKLAEAAELRAKADKLEQEAQ